MKSCRENDADKLWEFLRDGRIVGLKLAAIGIKRSVAYTRSIIKANPDRFDFVQAGCRVSDVIVVRARPAAVVSAK